MVRHPRFRLHTRHAVRALTLRAVLAVVPALPFPASRAWARGDASLDELQGDILDSELKRLEKRRPADERSPSLVNPSVSPAQPAGRPAARRSQDNAAACFDGLSAEQMLHRDWEYWDRQELAAGGYEAAARKALDLARRTYEWAARAGCEPSLPSALAALAKEADGAPTDWPGLYRRIRYLRRRIVLAHPLLRFESILAVKAGPPRYSHMCDQYLGRHSVAGDGLVVIENWRQDAVARRLLAPEQISPGSVHHPDLSFDAQRVVFAFCPHAEQDVTRRWFYLWEAATDGSWVRQLTGVEGRDPLETQDGRQTVYVEDWDPCYLPSGDIVFVSTRNQGFGRCHGGRYTPSYVLYRCDKDGNGIHRISWGEANEWDPAVLHDGSVVFTRWDYINRHDCLFQSLWTTRPDGAATAHFYGNNTPVPNMMLEARPIPGSHKVIATAGAHHSYTCGSLIVIDADRGLDGDAPLSHLTPDVPYPEQRPWAPTPGMHATYCNPWPLSEDLFLVSFSPFQMAGQGRVQEVNAYGIYLIDSLGGRELVYRDPSMSCLSPMPLQPRDRPQRVSSSLPVRAGPEGLFFLQDVYRGGRGEIPRGAARYLRVVAIFPQPEAGAAGRSRAANEVVKSIVGTVPIQEDGSAAFTAPANQSLLFQVLDENHMALMSMRSQTYVRPGERLGCVGCHEPEGTCSPPRPKPALTVRALDPPPGPRYQGGFSFARTVQPVLDRYCIRCHGLGRPGAGQISAPPLTPDPIDPVTPPAPRAARHTAPHEMLADDEPLLPEIEVRKPASPAMPKTPPPTLAGPGVARASSVTGRTLSLLGTPSGFSVAYDSLTQRDHLVCVAQRNAETWMSRPRDYGSHAGQLAAMLLSGHDGRVKLDPASFGRIAGWLDLNAQYCGDYSGRDRAEKRAPDPQAESALREHLRANCASCHADLPTQPYAALVNPAQPDESRVLRAVLAADAGGWAQCRRRIDTTSDASYQALLRKVCAASGVIPPEATSLAASASAR